MSVKVLLDHNVVINYCAKNRHRDFFYYLESHPNLGAIAKKPYEDIKRVIRRDTKDYRSSIDQYNKLPSYIELKNYSKRCNEIFPDIRAFLFNLVRDEEKSFSINLGAVSSRYRALAKDLCVAKDVPNEDREKFNQKILREVPERDDIMLLSETVCLDSKHKFIASDDEHFIDPFISKAIEKKYNIKCGNPDEILYEVKKHEHLFIAKLIL